ncbi:MAG TPA: hypothetical protein VEL74_00200 [Thermoanaerobaculia bacterium]|nr:hypothetical protein [Thermoanaerobaculia bacterium]
MISESDAGRRGLLILFFVILALPFTLLAVGWAARLLSTAVSQGPDPGLECLYGSLIGLFILVPPGALGLGFDFLLAKTPGERQIIYVVSAALLGAAAVMIGTLFVVYS